MKLVRLLVILWMFGSFFLVPIDRAIGWHYPMGMFAMLILHGIDPTRDGEWL